MSLFIQEQIDGIEGQRLLIMSEAAELPKSAPIGPGSEVWEHTGRRYNTLVALAGGTMQVMYPSLGAGVVEWSRFFEDPGERLANSIDPILSVIYGPDPDSTGLEIRDIHKNYERRRRPGPGLPCPQAADLLVGACQFYGHGRAGHRQV